MSKHVMVVDDEEDFLYEVEKILEKAGHRVSTAKSGGLALKMLADMKPKPDLLLLDVMMPGLDGWELAKKIRKHSDIKDITIAMLTVRGSVDDKLTSLEDAEATWHISKPIERARFVDTVNWLLTNPPRREAKR